MTVSPLRIPWITTVLTILVIAVVLSACSDSPAPTPIPTDTPTPAPTDTPAPAPMATPAMNPVDTPSPVLADTPTPAPTDTPAPAPTDTPTPAPTDTPAPSPTDTPTPSPTDTSIAADKAALLTLYDATDGLNWKNNANWLSEAPLGEWHGVVTDLSGRVKVMDLAGNQLSGEIPSELGDLTELTVLSLRGNQLIGEIPAELGGLTNLTGLDLAGNQLIGEIPLELGGLTNLTWVYLWGNELSGEIPAELGGLTNLTLLDLAGNQLSGEIPSELGGLTNQVELWLNENQLIGEIPAELGGLTNLTQLGLWENELSGEIPSELGGLTNLTGLGLSSNQFSGEIPSELGDLTNLTHLSLWGNELSGEIPSELGGLANLVELDVASNQLSGEIPAELGGLTNLTWLGLWGNQLSGEIPAELGGLTNLVELWLNENELSGEIPAELGSLTNLTELDVSSNQLSGEIPAELGGLTNLTWLGLANNQLSGCVPAGLVDVDYEYDDLDSLGLPSCLATPVAQMSPAEVYALVSPSVPFIETPGGTASGVLIEGGYVVTNYHVVWLYGAARVVFPDGTELQNVPVVGWDSMADLAVLGPVDVSARPLNLEDGEGTAPGSELFLLGYPAEVEAFPEPNITRGILSRFREWERFGMTYLQTDAAIAGGQSGGALVNSRGGVVGISTFSYSEAGFGLAASATEVAPIVEKLIQGEFTSWQGDRRFSAEGGDFEFNMELANKWDTRNFVLDAAAGTILQTEIEGSGDGLFRVYDANELLLEMDDGVTGIESGAVELTADGIHFLQVELFTGESSAFELTSSIGLKPFDDQDDGRTIAVGETVVGNINFQFDVDWYSLRLDEGETVRISTDSINVDTFVFVDFPNSRADQIVSDDDSGGGMFGQNSELVYRAPATGEYFIAVADLLNDRFGGYYLSVEQVPAGSETVYVPTSP